MALKFKMNRRCYTVNTGKTKYKFEALSAVLQNIQAF